MNVSSTRPSAASCARELPACSHWHRKLNANRGQPYSSVDLQGAEEGPRRTNKHDFPTLSLHPTILQPTPTQWLRSKQQGDPIY